MFSTVSVSGLWCVWTSYYSSHECWFKMIGDRRMTPTGWWFQIHDSFMSNHRNRMNIPNNDFWNSFFFVGRLKPPSSQLTNYCSRCRSQDHGHIGGPCLCKALCRRPGAGENFLWHFRGNWTENMFHNILHMLSHVMNVLLRMHLLPLLGYIYM